MSDTEPTATIPLGKQAMLGRRHSSSFSSMDAQYRALPQSPDASPDIGIPSAIEEGDMTVEDIDDSILDEHAASSAPVDSRIRWVHAMLGSAVLLPWNGASDAISLARCEA
jgi:equilibrative nucleoside transporter 1/2/3